MEKKLKETLPTGKFENVLPTHSKRMSAIKGKGNRTTELRLRMALVRAGLRKWETHPRGVTGNPDFFFPENRVAVFVDGCFWHGCARCGHIPSKNRPYWSEKIRRNQERDKEKTKKLNQNDITVLRFWEHELQEDMNSCITKIRDAIGYNLKKKDHTRSAIEL